ncbi:FliH/SctL family protein [Saccharibacter floricola]|uniref:Flagellar assembly protein FliH/Type III secretion system HrpE domain-containing protein n=1 Tax=Saccharibacter floricola DSM 15669 TaxID=1123227 RepID=A0ABQ0NXS1_9PROT|nr:hypothetical protein [Saccharibacter floricola]GBQ05872.1 hypothetical protein AA15669_0676 [Saccharibacter floricola DSM 15669]
MTSFADRLEDFGSQLTQEEDASAEEEQVDAPEEEPEIDHSVRLQPEEIEALKAEAYRAGQQAGEEKAQAELSEKMAQSIAQILTVVQEEGEHRSELLHHMADYFTEALYAVVKELVSGELKRDVIRRDMVKDIESFAQECEGDVKLSCSKEDAASLKTVLKDVRGVSMAINPELSTGRATLSAKDAQIMVDKNDWVNAVRDRILSSVRTIIQTSQQNSRTRT